MFEGDIMTVQSQTQPGGAGHGPATWDPSEKMVYSFGAGRTDGTGEMCDLLGGKGAGLAEMTSVGIPVPPGFTITTRVCGLFYALGGRLPEEYGRQQLDALRFLEESQGRKLGDAEDPLLVSVRSGARPEA